MCGVVPDRTTPIRTRERETDGKVRNFLIAPTGLEAFVAPLLHRMLQID
jgi:hypothetical protein